MFCDIHLPDGSPFEGDPRYVLKRTLARAAEAGYTFYVSPEIEFFYFRRSRSTRGATSTSRLSTVARTSAARRCSPSNRWESRSR